MSLVYIFQISRKLITPLQSRDVATAVMIMKVPMMILNLFHSLRSNSEILYNCLLNPCTTPHHRTICINWFIIKIKLLFIGCNLCCMYRQRQTERICCSSPQKCPVFYRSTLLHWNYAVLSSVIPSDKRNFDFIFSLNFFPFLYKIKQ